MSRVSELESHAWTAARLPRIAILGLLVSCGCSDLLGFDKGHLGAQPCSTDSECGPGELCKYTECVSRECPVAGERRCEGLSVMRCGSDGRWAEFQECDSICRNNECWPANSCEPKAPTCADNTSCCKSIELPVATFEVPYMRDVTLADTPAESPDHVERTIREVALDRFEVTVARFIAFMNSFESARSPHEGAGEHPAFPGSGWREEWSGEKHLVPDGTDSLVRELLGQEEDLVGDDRPVRGVTWYVAFAFCIWDGGRLPTEAEWAYAALGGDRRRTFPWESDDDGQIDHSRAVYSDDAGVAQGPEPVGSHPEGRGAFNHDDLAGNVSEWVADGYGKKMASSCDATTSTLSAQECLVVDGEESRVLRGGSFADAPSRLRNVTRLGRFPGTGRQGIGFRCARDLVSAH